MMPYISSSALSTKSSGSSSKPRLFSSIKTSLLRYCNTVPYEFQRYYFMSGMKVDLSQHEVSSDLKCIFLQTGLRVMLEGNEYRDLDLFFLFVFEHADI